VLDWFVREQDTFAMMRDASAPQPGARARRIVVADAHGRTAACFAKCRARRPCLGAARRAIPRSGGRCRSRRRAAIRHRAGETGQHLLSPAQLRLREAVIFGRIPLAGWIQIRHGDPGHVKPRRLTTENREDTEFFKIGEPDIRSRPAPGRDRPRYPRHFRYPPKCAPGRP
jgi:hypothetical protein